MVTPKQPGKASLLTSNLTFTTAQTVHTFDLKSLTPTVTVVEKETDKVEEVKPFTELKELTSERAPLDLAQRGSSVVSLLAEQRREQQVPTSGLEEPASRQQTIMVTSAHNFPAFSGQPTYLVSKFSKFFAFVTMMYLYHPDDRLLPWSRRARVCGSRARDSGDGEDLQAVAPVFLLFGICAINTSYRVQNVFRIQRRIGQSISGSKAT